MPAAVLVFVGMNRGEGRFVAAVMIGIDPRKGSHTAVALGADEKQLGRLRVHASGEQARQLTEWAAAWPERTWAVEGASGRGHLLAQQLVAAGERVLDVQPKLGARVRLLAAGDTNKNDPNDARSVAIAALRSAACRQVRADDHTAVLKLWSKRHRDLGRSRNQVACRLHAVLCELVPGGIGKEITASHAARLLEAAEPAGPAEIARWQLASDFLQDLRRLDEQMKQTKKKLAAAVKASGTTLTEVFGVGPVIAAIVLGEAEDVARFRDRDRFAAYNGTAPGRGVLGQADGAPVVAAREPPRQPRDPHGRDHPDPVCPQRGARLLRQEARRGQDFQGSTARPQAAHQRRPVPAAARRRPPRCQRICQGHGPGRASGERH
jgi:transposase